MLFGNPILILVVKTLLELVISPKLEILHSIRKKPGRNYTRNGETHK